ncbi:tubulin-like doman-containing protein [bacterium]|nr:tubulin-like doman-containing protein [bacterium]
MANVDMYRLLAGKIEKEEGLKAIRELSPTVLIGLGGTGKEVLLRLRKKFFEKYGSLDKFPIVSYVFIDTDTTNKFLTTETRDIVSPQIEFDQNEMVDASIESTSKYTSNLDNYPHIKKWFYPGLSALGNLREGAGQIRAYGRLGFFHAFNVIENRIREACQKVTHANNPQIMGKHGISVNLADVNIYIITSLAGGTGSGIFLDVAFLVKQLQQKARTIGFLALPRIFGNVPRCDANGYASLMELEYYSYGHNFEAGWRGLVDEKPLVPPPFDYCYLIDGVNESGMSIGEKDKSRIFELLADNIFIDFSRSDFGAFKRGVRINLAQYLQDMFAFVHYTPEAKGIMTETFPCRYFSFGLSSIGFPLDRIKNACAYKLGLDIVEHWIKLAQAPRPTIALRDEVLKEFLPEIGLLQGPWSNTVRNDISNALYKCGDLGEDFRRKINGWRIELRTNVHNNLPKVENTGWKQFLRNEIDKHLLICRIDVDPANCGEYIRIMDDNKEEFLTRIKEKLDSKIADIVSNQHKGVGFCREILKEIGIIFTAKEFGYIPRFESEQKALEGRLKNQKKKYEDILDEIGIIENEFWKINPQRQIALNFNLDRLIEIIYDYFWAIIQFHARKLAIEICNEILEYLGVRSTKEGEEIEERNGKANELAKLYTKISRLKSEFEKKYGYYSEPIENPLKVAIYSKNDIEQKYYPQYMGKDKRSKEDNIHLYSQRVLETLKIDLMRLPDLIEEVGPEEIEKRIVELTRIQFEKLGEDFNILDMFFTQKGTEGELFTEEKGKWQIQNAIRGTQPWLSRDKELGQFELALHKQRCFVGGHELASGAPNAKAKNLMQWIESQKPANAPQIAFYETMDKNEILFYTEIAGFPLAYSDAVRLLRPQYKQLIELHTELHTDYVSYKFKDLLMLTTQEREKLQEAQKSFLLGIILGIVKPELDKYEGKVIYRYDMQITMDNFEPQFLGFEDKAISTLFEKGEVRESIYKAVAAEIAKLGQEDKLIYLDALCSWYIDNIYKSEEIVLPGGVLETKAPAERLILVEVMRMIEKKVSANEKDEFGTVLKQLKKDIDKFSKEIYGKRVLQIPD